MKVRHHATGAPAGRLVGAELIVLLCALLVMLAGFLYALQQVRSDAARDFDRRAQLAGSYLDGRLQAAETLAERLRERVAADAGGAGVRVVPDAARKLWRQPLRAVQGEWRASAGGSGPLTGAQARELAAVIALEPRAAALLARQPELVQVSWLSAGQFRYALARTPATAVDFDPGLYRQPVWRDSQPAQNPGGAALISAPAAANGGGRIITVAAPVLQRQHLLGVVTLDLRGGALHALVAGGAAPGDVLLVDRHGHLLARDGAVPAGDTGPLPPPGERQWRGDDGTEWLARPLAGGRAYLLQRLPTTALLGAAAWRSLPIGFCFVLLAALAIVMLRLRQALDHLAQAVRRDALTGALNRRGLFEDAEVIRALAHRQRKPLAVVMFDIDSFRKVNGLHGHERGDKVLAALSHGIHHQVRDYDVVCRWSGEEFLVVMMLEAPGDAMPVAERLRNVAATSCLREALTLITISAGLAMWQDGESLDTVAARADECMREAKEKGRDRLESAPEVRAAAA